MNWHKIQAKFFYRKRSGIAFLSDEQLFWGTVAEILGLKYFSIRYSEHPILDLQHLL